MFLFHAETFACIHVKHTIILLCYYKAIGNDNIINPFLPPTPGHMGSEPRNPGTERIGNSRFLYRNERTGNLKLFSCYFETFGNQHR